jgi:hypothetical protein
MVLIANTINSGQNTVIDLKAPMKTSVDETPGNEKPAGTGNLTAGTVVPDAKEKEAILNTYNAVMDSIAVLMSHVSAEDQKVLLARLVAKLQKTQDNISETKIRADTETRTAAYEKQREQYEASAKKISEASHHDSGPFGWVKAAFQMLASTIAIGVGTLMIATGVGAPLGALMIAAGVVGMIMAIDSMVKMSSKDGTGIMGSIVLEITHDKEQAAKADLGFGIGMAAVGIIMAIAMFFVPGGQAVAVENAMMAAQTLQKAQSIAQNVATFTNAAATIGGSAAGVAEGVENYEAAKLNAGAMTNKSDAKKLDAIIAQLDELITQLLSLMQQAATNLNGSLDSLTDAMQDEGKSAEHKFVG